MGVKELFGFKDISNRRFGLLIRHAERDEIKDSEFGNDVLLTENGKRDAEKLGKSLSEYNVIRIYTSPVERCVQTAQFIKKGLQKNVEIVITNELGDPGFHVADADLAGKTYINHGFVKSYNDFSNGKLPEGWATLDYLKSYANEFLQSKTEYGGVTVFVSHDSLIANFALANNIKKYDTKTDWVPYLDGVLLDYADIKSDLKMFFTQYWKFLAVYAACKLNLFDSLRTPKSVDLVADEIKSDKRVLTFLLNALCGIGYLQRQNEMFLLKPISEFLTEEHPESLKYACMNWGSEHLIAWQNLDYTVKTGKNAFMKIYGKSFFDFLLENLDKLSIYHKAMFEYAKDDYADLCNKIDFSAREAIMDCGGGYGAAINVIKSNFPNKRCYLFDLPEVIDKVQFYNGIETIVGDFFESIPEIADTVILSRILHDWDDEHASMILKNCYSSLPTGGILYVIENCAEKIKDIDLLSLSMAVVCNSFERTTEEYKALCLHAGFVYVNDIQLNRLQTILIFVKS